MINRKMPTHEEKLYFFLSFSYNFLWFSYDFLADFVHRGPIRRVPRIAKFLTLTEATVARDVRQSIVWLLSTVVQAPLGLRTWLIEIKKAYVIQEQIRFPGWGWEDSCNWNK